MELSNELVRAVLSLIEDLFSGRENRKLKRHEFYRNQKIGYEAKHGMLRFYQNEITRYKNSINYITNKTLRAMNIERNYHTRTSLLNGFRLLTYTHFYDIRNFETILQSLITYIRSMDPSSLAHKRSAPLIQRFSEKLASFSWKIALEHKPVEAQLSIRYSIPSFFIRHLKNVMDYKDMMANMQTMDAYPSVGISGLYIRGAGLKSQGWKGLVPEQREILLILERLGVKFDNNRMFPGLFIFRNNDKDAIVGSDVFRADKIEILDPVSYLAVNILNPSENDRIGDFCAAPGTKTLVISDFTDYKAQIFCTDFHFNRLSAIHSRYRDMPSKQLLSINCDAINYPLRSNNFFDKILLDAPCTGSGTFGSNPELKWKQSGEFLKRNVYLQKKMLVRAYELLKPGGNLVYSVCSMYPEEGEQQVVSVLDKYKLMDLPENLPEGYNLSPELSSGCARFHPNFLGTGGFFIAKLQKPES